MKIGLVLEGGGMRGAYTAGVLDCFIDNGIVVDKVYGVSAGAINAASYISKQKGRNIVFWRDHLSNKKTGNFKNLFKTGFYFKNAHNDEDSCVEKLDVNTFNESSIEFEAVVTNVKTGEAEYMLVDDAKRVDDIVIASGSLPMFSRFIEIDGNHYLDGGLADSIPTKRAIEDGMDKVIVVLTQHKGYVKNPSKSYKIAKFKYRRYPKLVETIKNRHIMYNNQLKYTYSLNDEKSLIIQPKKPVEISRLEKDKEKINELYHDGYNDAQERINEIKEFIEKC